MRKDFDILLKPYSEGGLETAKVTRTLGTITSKLMLSYKHPADVVGLAIYKVFSKMANEGLEFKGDGSYGSAGAELFSCINAQCIELTTHQTVQKTIDKIKEFAACTRDDCRVRTQMIIKMTKWQKVKWMFIQPRPTMLVASLVSGVFLIGGFIEWLCIMDWTPLGLFLVEYGQKIMVLLKGLI